MIRGNNTHSKTTPRALHVMVLGSSKYFTVLYKRDHAGSVLAVESRSSRDEVGRSNNGISVVVVEAAYSFLRSTPSASLMYLICTGIIAIREVNLSSINRTTLDEGSVMNER